MNVGSLFAGIGGFDLGFERAGMDTAWFCEWEDYCQRVLARHWPGVPCYGDIRDLRGADVAPVDVLCGGFPCQDISNAGKRAGIEGSRSGLWAEYARLIRELRPRYVVVENVSALRRRGLDVVLGDLAACGYDAEWDCIPAKAVGAPHQRDRIWLVAYVGDTDREHGGTGRAGRPDSAGAGEPVAVRVLRDADLPYAGSEGSQGDRLRGAVGDGRGTRHVADAGSGGCDQGRGLRPGVTSELWRGRPCDASRTLGATWAVEPDVGRVAHGVPDRVDRLRALGNALVPQVAEWVGHRIIAHDRGELTDVFG